MPNVQIDSGIKIKYGIISSDRAAEDLVGWSDLYFCGRLHKPVKRILK